MQTIAQDNPFAGTITTYHAGSRRALWTGRLISGLAAAFLIFDGVGKLLEVQPVIDGTKLLTGYLGGAVATHVRVGNPLFTHVLFPTYVAALLWGGLMLRDARLRAFLPWRDRSHS